jgi:uncharacterized protein
MQAEKTSLLYPEERARLVRAAGNGDMAELRAFVERRPECVNETLDDRSFLLHAAVMGDAGFMRFLLETGADIEGGATDGYTPLMAAASNGREAAVALLIEKGANLDAQDKFGFTALILAADSGAIDTIRQLLAAGASTEACNQEGFTAAAWARHQNDPKTALVIDKAAADFAARKAEEERQRMLGDIAAGVVAGSRSGTRCPKPLQLRRTGIGGAP